jgi:hypothetical protein
MAILIDKRSRPEQNIHHNNANGKIDSTRSEKILTAARAIERCVDSLHKRIHKRAWKMCELGLGARLRLELSEITLDVDELCGLLRGVISRNGYGEDSQ